MTSHVYVFRATVLYFSMSYASRYWIMYLTKTRILCKQCWFYIKYASKKFEILNVIRLKSCSLSALKFPTVALNWHRRWRSPIPRIAQEMSRRRFEFLSFSTSMPLKQISESPWDWLFQRRSSNNGNTATDHHTSTSLLTTRFCKCYCFYLLHSWGKHGGNISLQLIFILFEKKKKRLTQLLHS